MKAPAYLLTSALESVVNDEGGTGNGLKLDNMPVAGKTGTTSATRDVWFAGFTPYYTCAVWAGYDTNEFLEDDCKSFHKNLWKKVMGLDSCGSSLCGFRDSFYCKAGYDLYLQRTAGRFRMPDPYRIF